MSPSEFDLRSALRDGEGDGPDPDSVLAAGRARASARRTRIAGVAGAVVAVLAVGTTGAVLLGHGGDGGGSTADRRDMDVAAGAASAGSGPSASSGTLVPDPGYGSSAGGPAASSGCPATFPAATIGGGGSSRLGGSGALFDKPVASVLVCGYGSTGSTGQPGTLTLLGAKATALVQSLESANTRKPSEMCPDYRRADDHRYAFVGLTAQGDPLPAVTTTIGGAPTCDVVVTNGSAVRFAWAPPTSLATALSAVAPK